MLATGGGSGVLEKSSNKPSLAQSPVAKMRGMQLQLQGGGGGGNHDRGLGGDGDGGGYYMRVLNAQERAIVLDDWKVRSRLYRIPEDEAIKEAHNKQLQRLQDFSGLEFGDHSHVFMALFKDAPELALCGSHTDSDQAIKVKLVLGAEFIVEGLSIWQMGRASVHHMAFTSSSLSSGYQTATLYQDAVKHVEGVGASMGYNSDMTPFENNPNYDWLARR